MIQEDAYLILGVAKDATENEIRRAWRQKARAAHPDVGGTTEEMLRLNEAAMVALSRANEQQGSGHSTSSAKAPRTPVRSHRSIVRDVSSFTIDRLPVDAWQLLEIAAAECGPIIEDTPPYLMEFMLHDSPFEDLVSSICRCELVPEAGGTTVHLSILDVAEHTDASIRLRDLLVAGINRIADDD